MGYSLASGIRRQPRLVHHFCYSLLCIVARHPRGVSLLLTVRGRQGARRRAAARRPCAGRRCLEFELGRGFGRERSMGDFGQRIYPRTGRYGQSD